jgi:hypothetical protein
MISPVYDLGFKVRISGEVCGASEDEPSRDCI